MTLQALFRFLPLFVLCGLFYAGKEDITGLARTIVNIGMDAKTGAEMAGVVKLLRLDLIAGQDLPDDIEEYARQRMSSGGTDTGLDAWQTPWVLDVEFDGTVVLASCGPDRICENDDDIVVAVTGPGGQIGAD
jgi:hypothetical protein